MSHERGTLPSTTVAAAALALLTLAACGEKADVVGEQADPCEGLEDAEPTREVTIRVNPAGKIVVTPARVVAKKGTGSVTWRADGHPAAVSVGAGPVSATYGADSDGASGQGSASGGGQGADASASQARLPEPKRPLDRSIFGISAGGSVTTAVNPEAECGRYKYDVAVFVGDEAMSEATEQEGQTGGRGRAPSVLDPPFMIVP